MVSHERERVSAEITEVADRLGREVSIAIQDEPLGTGDAARAGMTGLPDDFDGTVLVTVADAPLLDGDTLEALVDAHTAAPPPPSPSPRSSSTIRPATAASNAPTAK